MIYLAEDKAIQFAYSTIHDFFDFYGLEDAIWYWETIVKAAGDQQPWKKDAPSHLLLFIEKLQQLCAAAITISNGYPLSAVDALIEPSNKHLPPNLSQQANFVNQRQYNNSWNCFPRSLSQKQYKDPYKAIKKFAAYIPETSCVKKLKDIQEYALSRNTIDGEYTSGQLLKIRLRILQLIESCHLIEVRTNNPKTKTRKSKKKRAAR